MKDKILTEIDIMMTQEFNDLFLGVNFDYVSTVNEQRLDAKSTIIDFIQKQIRRGFNGGMYEAFLSEGYPMNEKDWENIFKNTK